MAQLHLMRVGEFKAGLEIFITQWLSGKKDLVGIQIGSYQGESTQMFLNSGAFKKLYCIDPWIEDYDDSDCTCDGTVFLAQQAFDKRFKDDPRVEKIKDFSTNAFNRFENQSIDFIYIDGCHQYEAVKQDLKNYFPKIKVGGMVSGHDYGGYKHTEGTKRAIDQFFGLLPLKVYEDRSWIYIKGYNPVLAQINQYIAQIDNQKK